MHEKRGEDRGPGRGWCLDYTGQGFSPGQLNRNKAPGKEEDAEGPVVTAEYDRETADGQLVEEHQAAYPNEGYVDNGEAAMMGVGVGERKQKQIPGLPRNWIK